MSESIPTLDYQNFSKHRQGYDLDRGMVIGGVAVRIRVHHDTSYPDQSRAVAEVWSPTAMAWNEAATYLPAQWADDRAAEAGATAGLWEADGELEARVRSLLP